jgi:hypothetical protein
MNKYEKAFFQVFICLSIGLFVWTAARIVSFPFGVDYGEAPIMDQIRQIENGGSIYKANVNEAPYIILNYPPLYPLLVAGIHLLVRLPLFQVGRLVSLFFGLISGGVIGVLCFQLTNDRLLGLLAVVLFLGHPYVMAWSSIARVDLMALAFSLLGLLIVFQKWNSYRFIGISILCFLISAFTRQTYILAGPLAGFVFLWHHDYRRGLTFATLFGVSGISIFIGINAITKGGFYTDIVSANINQYYFSRTIYLILHFFEVWPFVLLLLLLGVTISLATFFKKYLILSESDGYSDFIRYGLVFYSVGAILSTITTGKVGSSVNYFLELISAGVIWCVIAIKYIIGQRKSIKMIFTGLLIIQLIWVIAFSTLFSDYIIGSRWRQISNIERLYQQVKLATQKGQVLSDDFLDLVVLSGQSIYYEPATYGQMYYTDIWKPTQFIEEIELDSFPLILIGGNTLDKPCCWPAPVTAAIRDSYTQVLSDTLVILTPKK